MTSKSSTFSPWQGEAVVVACTLQAAGIPAIVADWHFISIKPSLEFGSSRPRVLIPPAYVADAQDWLDFVRQQTLEPMFPCPDCGAETRRTRRWFAMAIITLLGSFHPFFSSRRWCEACQRSHAPAAPAPFTEEELGYPVADTTPGSNWFERLRTAGMNGAYGRPDE
ncbi:MULTISPECIES: hypothetical protein [Maricaulis]|uniref:DUF2007 domain-containing protein n=1 Tax=Maricaulis maris (strain MCS10) TaxID=394221 RepID=Q0AQ52_MARMM|nr:MULTISPECIES: hypothetical protein [Maricaulis]ABI65585.1 hypothetical protein Mmar10_1293 [Maricaulis maris MCS10]MAC90152.1 hypothetical protein [Maricaulis sp.]